jgi:AraC-like DNA-binding protein
MQFSLNFVSIIILLAAIQGFFLAILLFKKYHSLYANRFLGLLLFCYSFILVHLFLQDTGFYNQNPHLLYILLSLPLLIGPLHFLYARFLIQPSARFDKKQLLHFLPFIIYTLMQLPFLFKSSGELLSSLPDVENEGFPLKQLIFNEIIIIQGLVYTIYTLVLIRKYSYRLKEVFSALDKVKLTWLRNITLMALTAIGMFILEIMLFFLDLRLLEFGQLSSFLIAIYVYTLGYWGMLKSEIFLEPAVVNSMNELNRIEPHEIKSEVQSDIRKYEKSGLSEEKAQEILDSLLSMMQKEKPYRNSEITLTQLANSLSFSPHNLSEVINSQLQKNFFDFMNEYRVEEVKQDLKDPAKKHLKILAIAFDAGFNSKSSFNTIFKKQTGMTPSEFRELKGK